MDIAGKRIWQVAPGGTDRIIADVCLDWDVILNGPGSEGAWPECQERLTEKGDLSSRKIADLRRFVEEITDGDIVVLRMGSTDVLGVGIMVGDYSWREEFGDIDGLDLQHVRRVKWLWKYEGMPKRFNTFTLRLGDAVQSMESQEVKDWLNNLPIRQSSIERPLVELPGQSRKV